MGDRDDTELAEHPVVGMRRVPTPGLDPGPQGGPLPKQTAASDGHACQWCRDAIRPDEGQRDRLLLLREVREAGRGDSGQPNDLPDDLGGSRRGRRKEVHVRQGLRDLGAFPRGLDLLSLERPLPGHIALDRHVARDGSRGVEDGRHDAFLLEDAAVLAPVRDVGHERLPARERRPHRRVVRRSLDAALEDARVLPHHLLARVARARFEGRVDVLDRATRVGDDDRIGGLFDRRGEAAYLELGAMAGSCVADRDAGDSPFGRCACGRDRPRSRNGRDVGPAPRSVPGHLRQDRGPRPGRVRRHRGRPPPRPGRLAARFRGTPREAPSRHARPRRLTRGRGGDPVARRRARGEPRQPPQGDPFRRARAGMSRST